MTVKRMDNVGIVVEDIEAQRALNQARSDYITAVAEYDKAQYQLNRAIGGSFEGATLGR